MHTYFTPLFCPISVFLGRWNNFNPFSITTKRKSDTRKRPKIKESVSKLQFCHLEQRKGISHYF